MKFANSARKNTVLQDAKGQLKFKHDNGELSHVNTELAEWECMKLE